MPTTTNHPDPTTIALVGDTFVGAQHSRTVNPDSRQSLALRDRLLGMTWREVADAHGYRSARAAEANVGRYVAWLNGRQATSQIAGTPGMSLRSFGVEIEFSGLSLYSAARAISAVVGYDVMTASYHSSSSYSQWRVERDGSVTTSSGMGGEAISPIMSGAADLQQVADVMQALRAAGARVDRRCGMHVHLDARDLTGEQIARLMVAYVDRQDAIDTLVSPSRRQHSGYCARIGETEKVRVAEAFKTYGKDQGARLGRAERYRTVNLLAVGRVGTVEFRQHQGTLNGTKAAAWVKMLLALATATVATADESLPLGAPELIESLTAHGLDRAAARHLTARSARS